MIEGLIDIVSKLEEQIGDEGLYISKSIYQEAFKKQINNAFLLDNLFILLLNPQKPEETSILKFELYILMIFLSKGSFEAKINCMNIYLFLLTNIK